METLVELRKKRDEKVTSHLSQYAPVWIIDEKWVEEDESLLFNVLFQHNTHGWMNRRYKYDGFNNVLYHKGQTTVDESEVLDVLSKEPYLDATLSNIPNAYGG